MPSKYGKTFKFKRSGNKRKDASRQRSANRLRRNSMRRGAVGIKTRSRMRRSLRRG